jgi:DNA-binding transcriptional LysR family regulator
MARALGGARIALRADSLVSMREAAAAGVGVAALPCYLADGDSRLRRIRGPVPDLATELWLLVHQDLRRTARIRALVDFLATALAGQRDLLEGRAVRRRK